MAEEYTFTIRFCEGLHPNILAPRLTEKSEIITLCTLITLAHVEFLHLHFSVSHSMSPPDLLHAVQSLWCIETNEEKSGCCPS